jgi:hypothetical protein
MQEKDLKIESLQRTISLLQKENSLNEDFTFLHQSSLNNSSANNNNFKNSVIEENHTEDGE